MFVRNLEDCREFKAADGSILRELLHAEKGDFKFRYSLAQAKVKTGQGTKAHRLKNCEVYYILEGKGLMHINEEAKDVSKGCVIYIPPNSKQYIENKGNSDLIFLCIVDPAWRPEDEEVFLSRVIRKQVQDSVPLIPRDKQVQDSVPLIPRDKKAGTG